MTPPVSLSFPPSETEHRFQLCVCVEGNVGGGVVEVSRAIGHSLTHTNYSLPNFFQHSPITATHTLIHTLALHTHSHRVWCRFGYLGVTLLPWQGDRAMETNARIQRPVMVRNVRNGLWRLCGGY